MFTWSQNWIVSSESWIHSKSFTHDVSFWSILDGILPPTVYVSVFRAIYPFKIPDQKSTSPPWQGKTLACVTLIRLVHVGIQASWCTSSKELITN
jgi:hypothetical protein